MPFLGFFRCLSCALAVLGVTTQVTFGQEDAATQEALLAGHNAWMLTCTALVLFMAAPGLAMFHGGLVRRKNVLGVMMQCVFLMGLMTVLWALYGYSLAFGGNDNYENPWHVDTRKRYIHMLIYFGK